MSSSGDWPAGSPLDGIDDEVFVALSDRVRRIAVYYLRFRGRVDVEELADVVTGWRFADRAGMATAEHRERTLAELRARHIPTLADAGLVDYDAERGSAAIGRLPGLVGSLIDSAAEYEDGRNEP